MKRKMQPDHFTILTRDVSANYDRLSLDCKVQIVKNKSYLILRNIKPKDRKMFKHINKRQRLSDFILHESVPDINDYTKLFGQWKTIGRKVDLNMM